MKKLIHIFDKLPSGTVSIVILIIILILTLDENPVSIELPNVVGMDKLVHGIMFGGLAMSICLDVQRRDWSKLVGVRVIIFASVVSSLVGIVVEMMQHCMANGRTYEGADIVADVIGAIVFALIARVLFKKYGV